MTKDNLINDMKKIIKWFIVFSALLTVIFVFPNVIKEFVIGFILGYSLAHFSYWIVGGSHDQR